MTWWLFQVLTVSFYQKGGVGRLLLLPDFFVQVSSRWSGKWLIKTNVSNYKVSISYLDALKLKTSVETIY